MSINQSNNNNNDDSKHANSTTKYLFTVLIRNIIKLIKKTCFLIKSNKETNPHDDQSPCHCLFISMAMGKKTI